MVVALSVSVIVLAVLAIWNMMSKKSEVIFITSREFATIAKAVACWKRLNLIQTKRRSCEAGDEPNREAIGCEPETM